MNKIANYLIVFMFSVLGVGSISYAQQISDVGLEQLFTINNIEVDEKARNASIARSQAISKAESIAFDKLKIKLVSADDLHLLADTDFLDIKSLVRGIQVREEKAFSNRYIANIDITFSAEAIIKIFTDAGASFILNSGSALCIAHAHRDGLITRLWEADNHAMAIWKSTDLFNRIRFYKVAQGTLQERRSLDVKSAEIGGFESAESLGRGCGTGAGLIVHTASIVNPVTGQEGLSYQYYISDMQIEDKGNIFMLEGENIEALMSRLIFKIIDASDQVWRQTSLLRGDEKGEILVQLPTDDVVNLARAQQLLANLAVVSDVQVIQIGVPMSELKLSYTGSQDQLKQAVQQVGYILELWGEENLLVRKK